MPDEIVMQDVMVDLETLGKRAGCVVLSIGAVAFDFKTGQLGPKFYQIVNTHSALAFGLHTDPDTVAWWAGRSSEARHVLDGANSTSSFALDEALLNFNHYLAQFDSEQVRVWGNGADFDNAILLNCYAATGVEPGWQFWNNRCYRTLKAEAPMIKLNRVGVYHNALDDAISQAHHAIEVKRALGTASRHG